MNDNEQDWFSHPRFATELEARVVDTSETDPRIHGYQVAGDLARHFSFSDTLLLSLTGEEPETDTSAAFGRAMIALAPIGVGSAPCHVGVLSQLVTRSYVSSLAAASVVLAERAAACVAERQELLAHLRESRAGALERAFVPGAPSCDPVLRSLLESCTSVAKRPWFGELDQISAIVAVLYECGLREEWQLESALFLAWTPCMMAEMGSRAKDPLESYPINLPRFKYVAQ